MFKTEQTRTAAFATRVDKPLEQSTLKRGKRKPQYLDVALAQGSSYDQFSNTKAAKNSKGDQHGLKNVTKENNVPKQTKVNAFTGKQATGGSITARTSSLNDVRVSKDTSKTVNTDRSDNTAHTFKERAKFESQKNQKLYERLDRMLAGGYGIKYPDPEDIPPPDTAPPVKNKRKERVTVITKEALFPSISKEARQKYTTGDLPHTGVVRARPGISEENVTLETRELKAKARLDKLDRIDSFSFGDFTRKTKNRQPLAGPVQSNARPILKQSPNPDEQITQTASISVGIPINSGETTSRRHIVADVPVYLPHFAGGNQPVQTVVNVDPTKPVPIDRVYESTIPGAKSQLKPGQKLYHAPEAFVGPVPGLDTVVSEVQGGDPVLNTYRSYGNPISERLLREQAERGREILDRGNLKYFDEDPNESEESGKKSVPATLHSDPGPHDRVFSQLDRSVDTNRTSPEGYRAQLERQHRLEKEAKIIKKAEVKQAFKEEPEHGLSTRRGKYDNQYQVDFYAQKTRSEIRLKNKDLEREDSWIKEQLEKPLRSPANMDSYRGQGYGGNSYRGGPYGADTDRGQGTYRVEEHDQKRDNRSYKLPDAIKERERYGERDQNRYSDRGERTYREEDKHRQEIRERERRPPDRDVLPYDSRYERERRDMRREEGREKRDYVRDDIDRKEHERRDEKRELDRRDERRSEPYRGREERKSYEPDRETERYNDRDRNTFGKDDRRVIDSERRDTSVGQGRPNGVRDERDRRDYRDDARYDRSQRQETNRERDRYETQRSDDTRQRPSPGEDRSRPSQGEDRSRNGNRNSDGKVQYVLRSKSSEMRKSRSSQKSGPLPESVPPSSTELVREKSTRSSKYSFDSNKLSPGVQASRPSGNSPKALPTYETAAPAADKKSDDMNKYFDDPDRPVSPTYYSDSSKKGFTKPKDFRNGELMTPVQEMSVKMSEDDDKESNATKKDKSVKESIDPYERSDKPKLLLVNENKHDIKEDRRSPWRKDEETPRDGKSPSLKEDPPSRLMRIDSDRDLHRQLSKGPDSVEVIKERIREKTLEKMKEKEMKIELKPERERTIDSQGPTDNKDKIEVEDEDLDDLDLDNIETEMDGNELYVCYLVTDNGEKIGPLKLDINDVKVGLPNAEKLDKLMKEEEAKSKEEESQSKEVNDEGMRNRQTGSHGLNEFSSRSHSMLMLTIDSEMQDPDDENLYITKRGKLTFVDLAGSEKVKDSNSTSDTLVESNSINKSLLVLGNCISSLGDHKRRLGHIPYRDSKLTKLLADSLGGNGVTLMICCITPSSHHASETMNTLRYASRAKKIRTKPVVKMDPREKLILSLKREIKVLRNENHYLREQPKPKSKTDTKTPGKEKSEKPKLEFPAKPKGQLQKENDQKFAQMIKETNGKPAETNTAPTAPSNPGDIDSDVEVDLDEDSPG
ncbi:uncharacterized protein DDB_G0283697-like isoform X6 [Mya arenaria]|uniref:uncharacterized protein DDB_G0283697-like isoform X6 n=1 Tax=Mya arenaria TaxID=6604 RepID=UPI0022DEDC4A|nr:uncharacterized protein DDB_G0283697-like isoform X6 [Mya arenaria]